MLLTMLSPLIVVCTAEEEMKSKTLWAHLFLFRQKKKHSSYIENEKIRSTHLRTNWREVAEVRFNMKRKQIPESNDNALFFSINHFLFLIFFLLRWLPVCNFLHGLDNDNDGILFFSSFFQTRYKLLFLTQINWKLSFWKICYHTFPLLT